jgi:glycine dehydrogenase subunit 1
MDYTQLTESQRQQMLATIGVESFEALLADIPADVRLDRPLDIPAPLSEPELLARLDELACSNDATHKVCFLGGGAYDHFIPTVVNALASQSEFVTAYTPYQAEASQGTLQVFYEFQTMVCQLTGMEVANASLYEAGSAVAEAVLMLASVTGKREIVLPATLHPHYREIVATYVDQLPLTIIDVPMNNGTTDLDKLAAALGNDTAAVVLPTPNFFGNLERLDKVAAMAESAAAPVVAVVDPIAMSVLKRPGDFGVDVVVAEGQPLGIPLSYGGPWLGLMAARKKYMRKMPGRLIGRTVDQDGNPAYCLALQTREQHIRREKATSNVCTNQGLLAYRASIYMSAMGQVGLARAARLCLSKARYAAGQIAALDGFELVWPDVPFFKEFLVRSTDKPVCDVLAAAAEQGILAGVPLENAQLNLAGVNGEDLGNCFLVAVTEKRTRAEIDRLVEALAKS